MASVTDDRGYNQGFKLVESTRVRMERRAEYIASQISKEPQKTILEIGCGTGEVSFWLAQATGLQVIGTDLCKPFIESARARYNLPTLQFEVVDFNNPQQVRGRRFDYVVGNGILHHLFPTLKTALVAIREMLNPGGKIIFIEPNIYNPYCAFIFNYARTWAKLEPDEMAFSRRYITKILQDAGYSGIHVRYGDFLIPGVPPQFIKPSIFLGDYLEKIWPLNRLSQSLFIIGEAPIQSDQRVGNASAD
jgi:SAM-dependent methyltransferase